MLQTIEIDTRELDSMAKTMQEYQLLSGKTSKEVAAKFASEAAYQLYRATAQEAPERQEIRGLKDTLGFRIKFFRNKSGAANQRKTGRKKRADINKEIAMRTAARKSVAAAFIQVRRKARSQERAPGGLRPGYLRTKLGSLLVTYLQHNDVVSTKIVIENRAEYITQLDAKRGVIRRGLAATEANAQSYIDRKYKQLESKFKAKGLF